jgi:uroporphyrinogen decarboxylase
MTDRENLIGLLRRTGYERMPLDFTMCPAIRKKLDDYCAATGFTVPPMGYDNLPDSALETVREPDFWLQFYDRTFREGTSFCQYGVAREPGSAACNHLTYMYHPLDGMTTLEELQAYPFPKYLPGPTPAQLQAVERIHAAGRFAMGNMPCTVWETAWYARGMENIMMDMVAEPELAEFVLDTVTENAVIRAVNFAKAGADGLYLGDDIGMQSTPMMSLELYRTFLKPRLKKVIDAARAVNPDIIVQYHSCGYVEPFIPELIEIGVDVLNPVQPECMDFEKLYAQYGDKLSFSGLLGTQTLMPFGTPEEVRATVNKYLDKIGPKGGLYICPTHMLEPEVPIENVIAYIEACRDYVVKK